MKTGLARSRSMAVRAATLFAFATGSVVADTIFTDTYDPNTPFGNASTGWTGLHNATGGSYGNGIASALATTRTLRYLYAQITSGGAAPSDYLLYTNHLSAIDTSGYTNLYATWLQSGDSLDGLTNNFAVQVGGDWYATDDYTLIAGGSAPKFDLLDSGISWQKIDLGTLLYTADPAVNSATLFAGGSITGLGFYADDLPGYTSGNVTLRLDNLRITDVSSADNNWLGLGGAGGDGTWDNSSSGYGNWETGTFYKWSSSNKQAVFGGANDAGTGGTVTLISDLTSPSTSVKAPGSGDIFALKFLSKADGYIIQGDATPRTMTLEGDIYVDPAADVTFGTNLKVTRTARIQIDGGGTLNLEGATVEATGNFIVINGGTTVNVKTGGVISSADSFVLGNFVTTNGASGDATVVIDGGQLNAGYLGGSPSSGGSRNFVMGGPSGHVEVNMLSGELNVNPDAGNNFAYYNTDTGTVTFNLDGGIVTARHVRKNGGAAIGQSILNFNGGTFRLNATPSSSDLLGGSITYNVKAGGAKFDTNGFDATINQTLQHSGVTTDGGLTKLGAGTLTLNGSHTFNGATSVNGGRLLVSGSISGSAVTVNDTGTLGGTGATGSITVKGGGTLAPGASIGTLTSGALSLEANATFALEINTTALTSDRAATTGSLSLAATNDVVLTISDLAPAAISSGTFTFITYTGTWNGGLFQYGGNAIADGGLLTVGTDHFMLDYDLNGTSVALIAVPEPGSLLSLLGGCGVLLGLGRQRSRTETSNL